MVVAVVMSTIRMYICGKSKTLYLIGFSFIFGLEILGLRTIPLVSLSGSLPSFLFWWKAQTFS